MATATTFEVITLASIKIYFKDNVNCISKGELKYKSDIVLEVRLIDMAIHASVRASMKDRSLR